MLLYFKGHQNSSNTGPATYTAPKHGMFTTSTNPCNKHWIFKGVLVLVHFCPIGISLSLIP